jgi:DNA primase
MSQIPKNFIDSVLSRLNIVDVINDRIKLKKNGKNHGACCPFHDEKSASFTVSEEKQFYHCFGCGAHGNAIGFIMQYDSLGFPAAVKKLGGSVGLFLDEKIQNGRYIKNERALKKEYTDHQYIVRFFNECTKTGQEMKDESDIHRYRLALKRLTEIKRELRSGL